jgi:DNA-binding transcriptional ArsR family regulator
MGGRRKGKSEAVEGRLAALEESIERIGSKIAALERRPSRKRRVATADGDTLDFLELLRGRKGKRYERGEVRGAVGYAGAVMLSGPRRHLFVKEHALPELLEGDVDPVANGLSALGHASRLRIILALLEGPRSRQELQDCIGASSSGPLYHHLRELMAMGVVIQPKRNNYQIFHAAVVPLLVIAAAIMDISGNKMMGIASGEMPEEDSDNK